MPAHSTARTHSLKETSMNQPTREGWLLTLAPVFKTRYLKLAFKTSVKTDKSAPA